MAEESLKAKLVKCHPALLAIVKDLCPRLIVLRGLVLHWLQRHPHLALCVAVARCDCLNLSLEHVFFLLLIYLRLLLTVLAAALRGHHHDRYLFLVRVRCHWSVRKLGVGRAEFYLAVLI